jgi:hypothetical protein
MKHQIIKENIEVIRDFNKEKTEPREEQFRKKKKKLKAMKNFKMKNYLNNLNVNFKMRLQSSHKRK